MVLAILILGQDGSLNWTLELHEVKIKNNRKIKVDLIIVMFALVNLGHFKIILICEIAINYIVLLNRLEILCNIILGILTELFKLDSISKLHKFEQWYLFVILNL